MIISLIAGVLSTAGGAAVSSAILLGGAAFAGAVTLLLAIFYALKLL
ncbi:hypothetical protein [Streptosporangium oxazolinicum]